MAKQPAGWIGTMLARSISQQKAARVKLETGLPTLETRMTALATRWEDEAERMIDGSWIDCLRECAEELRAELER